MTQIVPDSAALIAELRSENADLRQTVTTLWARLDFVLEAMARMCDEAGIEPQALAAGQQAPRLPSRRLSVVR